MNTKRHFEEEDLALYAMRLLAEPEASEVARFVATSEQARRQLVQVQAKLAAYAEAEVDLHEIPAGSLDRLMRRIAQEKKVLATAAPVFAKIAVPAIRSRAGRKVQPWLGWAAAAVLLFTAGKLYQDQAALQKTLKTQTAQLQQMSEETVKVRRERDLLQADIATQAKKLDSQRTETAAQRSETANLRSTITGQTARTNEETAKANEQTALTVNTARQLDMLREQLAAQASRISQLSAEAAAGRHVLQALTDPTALRVTLTKPKSRAAPTGRATYVASRGTLVFLASNLVPLKPHKIYQLWLMPADGSKPVPAGTFAPDAQGTATVVNAQFSQATRASGFSVTIENEGGSQTPTLPIILASS